MAGNLIIKNLENAEFKITHPDGAGAINILSNDVETKTSTGMYKSSVDVNFATDADLTLDSTQNGYGIINLTDTGVVLTLPRNVIVSTTQRDIIVYNNTAQVLTVKTSAGTGVTIPVGFYDLLRCDGINIVRQANRLSGNTIAIGSSVFTNVDNNIALTGIGVGVEVGDVIQITGSTNNNGEFTVEVITDDNNVIVNQAHAGGTTSKSLVDETATVSVILLCKWYLAPVGLGQGWVDVTASRLQNVSYPNSTNRTIKASISSGFVSNWLIYINGLAISQNDNSGSTQYRTLQAEVPNGDSLLVNTYNSSAQTYDFWNELR